MPLTPAVLSDVPADVSSMKSVLGPKLATQYLVNPEVAKYAFVLKFPDGVITGRALPHALSKLPIRRGPTLLAGYDFTVEAMEIAKTEGCEVVAIHSYFWTDARYADRG